MDTVRDGADTILNLAAGLDTRPYQLLLSSGIRWIEVDFPEMIAYKEGKLVDAHPKCALERVALDLTDRTAREQLFVRVNEQSSKVLVITEGLLIYSPRTTSPPSRKTCTPCHIFANGLRTY